MTRRVKVLVEVVIAGVPRAIPRLVQKAVSPLNHADTLNCLS